MPSHTCQKWKWRRLESRVRWRRWKRRKWRSKKRKGEVGEVEEGETE